MKKLNKKITQITLLILIMVTASCSKDDAIEQEILKPTTIELVSGANQVAAIENELPNPIEISVKDQNGNPFSGVKVKFALSDGALFDEESGAFNATTTNVYTNSNGIASSNWVLGTTEGTQTMTVTAYQLDNETPLPSSPLIIEANTTSCISEINYAYLEILDNTTVISTTNITNNVNITDVNVTIDIAHSFIGDLLITLISPNGTEVLLTQYNGHNGTDYYGTIFDDQASISIIDGAPPYEGVFKPEGNLSDFNGLQSEGDWKLEVNDNATEDTGTLVLWSLEICGD